MITVFPFSELGNHNYGWLNAHYHFNFSDYYNPDKSGYPPLIVWYDDRIQPGTGFPMHSHRDMEIITYIRQGAITHEDSLGNRGSPKRVKYRLCPLVPASLIPNITMRMLRHCCSRFGFNLTI